MKILHTCNQYRPSVGGVAEVVAQVSERLVEKGHNVTVATRSLEGRNVKEINGVRIEEFDISGNLVRGFEAKETEIERYQDFLVNSNFDIQMHYAAQQWSADLAFAVLDEIQAKKVLVPCGLSGLDENPYKNYFENLPKYLKEFDACVYASKGYQDVRFARKKGVKNDVFIPNAADEREFEHRPGIELRKNLGIDPDSKFLLTVGSHTNQKGHEELIRIFDKLKIGNSALLIAARDKDDGCGPRCRASAKSKFNFFKRKFRNKNVLVRELSRKEVVAAFFEANLFVFLSNIECAPVVIYEAMAAGTPFASTDVGNVAELANESGAGIILPTQKVGSRYRVEEVKAQKILEDLIQDEEKLKKMGERGRINWRKKYTWSKIADEYEKLYLSLVKEG